MEKKNLPIKIILQRNNDVVPNKPNGSKKFFGEVNDELQDKIINQLEEMADYYKDILEETSYLPIVGKLKVKKEAMAKSHKPDRLFKNMPIIGSEYLDEMYFKVTKKGLEKTIEEIRQLPAEEFKANLTVVDQILPYYNENKISEKLERISKSDFDKIKDKIKIKLFNFLDEYDNELIKNYVNKELKRINLYDKAKFISYGDKINYIQLSIHSNDDIKRIAEINGVKSVDFFEQYYAVNYDDKEKDTEFDFPTNNIESDVIIGIIDSGISDNNKYLKDYIYDREIFVGEDYINPAHGTFVASMIQYGDILNDIDSENNRRFKFLDVVAIPNSNPNFGPVDGINEKDLMDIIETVVETHHEKVKVWNLSLGNENNICNGKMSDLAIFCDYIQDKYEVQFFISSGNKNSLPLRTWPSQISDDSDRIISPADSVRAITVGSIAHKALPDSIVKSDEPSPFSRRGPGANYIVKPDVVDYGGNYRANIGYRDVGMKGLGINGEVIENVGTSFSTPRVVRKYASILDEMNEKDDLLARAMLIHSARMNSRDKIGSNNENIKYYGFGMPEDNINNILLCSENEVTLVFRQRISSGSHLELLDFPYPESLIKENKYTGEIGMTLLYNSPLDAEFGQEYCRTNINVGFGPYRYKEDGKLDYKSEVPLEKNWESRCEKEQVENGFKWSPTKSYYRNIKNGLKIGDGWKLRVDMMARYKAKVIYQDFVLILTIRDNTEQNDIYSEVINGLRNNGYITSDLMVRSQVRARN